MLVLDTDHLTILKWQPTTNEGLRLIHRLEQHQDEEPVTTIVTYEEQCRGWLNFVSKAKSRVQLVTAYRKLSMHIKVYSEIERLDFDDEASLRFQELRQARLGIGAQDLKIAAIALVHQATLLSRNLRDFMKVPGLRVADWTN